MPAWPAQIDELVGIFAGHDFYDHRDFAMVDVIRLHCSKGATLAQWVAMRGFARAKK
jgi:hypothetical protein